MELRTFYTQVLESFGMEVDSDGYVKIDGDEFVVDDKPVVVPTRKIVSMLKSSDTAEVYLFNPLMGNKNIVREEYKKLLYTMNVHLYVAVKSLMLDITRKFMENDSSGLATPTTFAELLTVKGQAKKLVDDGVLKVISDLTFEDVVEVNIARNTTVLGEKVDAALSIHSPILSGEVDEKFPRRKDKDYTKKLTEIILHDIITEGKLITSSAGDKAQFLVLLKANSFIYTKLSEFARDHEVDLNYPVPKYDLDKLGEEIDNLVVYAETLPDVVGDTVVKNNGIVKEECEHEEKTHRTKKKSSALKTKRDEIVEKIAELRKKDTLTLSEINKLRELENALEMYEDPRTGLARSKRRRSRPDDYDEYEARRYGRRSGMRRRPPTVEELYEMRRRGMLDNDGYDDDLPW